jgi:probable F420-dependent oxidoreductase
MTSAHPGESKAVTSDDQKESTRERKFMSIRLGFALPVQKTFAIGRDIPEVARAAEQIGYDSLWGGERVLFPESPADGLFGIPGLPWPDSYRSNADPMVTLTLAAAATKRVELGTSVLVAGLHQPFQLARALATLDSASGGRVVAGLGTGWSRDEYAAAGVVPFERRGPALDEALAVCAAVWGPDPVSFTGPLSTMAPSEVGPKPTRPIPVLLAGATLAGFRRITDHADGWIPVATDPAHLAGQWKQLQALAAERDRRRPIRLSIVTSVTITPGRADEQDRPAFAGSLEQVTSDAIGSPRPCRQPIFSCPCPAR